MLIFDQKILEVANIIIILNPIEIQLWPDNLQKSLLIPKFFG